jgi:hypothetical protein
VSADANRRALVPAHMHCVAGSVRARRGWQQGRKKGRGLCFAHGLMLRLATDGGLASASPCASPRGGIMCGADKVPTRAVRGEHRCGAMDRFKKLNVSQLRSTSCCMLVGRRGTGKTVLMKNLAYHMFASKCQGGEEIDMAVVFSPTEKMQHVFDTFVPKCFIYTEYREDIIEQLLATQRELIEKNGHTKTILLILDDLAYDRKFFTTRAFRELVMNGRHCKIFIMCAVQYVMDIPTAIRGNIDVSFSMSDNSAQVRDRLWSNLFSQVPRREFPKIFDKLTDNRRAIVSINSSNSNKLEDTLFWYRADPENCPQKFMLGLPIFWKMSDLASGGDGTLPPDYVATAPLPPPPLPPPPPQAAKPVVAARPAFAGPTSPQARGEALSPLSPRSAWRSESAGPGPSSSGAGAEVQRTWRACGRGALADTPAARKPRPPATAPQVISW